MYSTRCSPVAAFSLLLVCRCFRTGAQSVGGVEGGSDITSAAAFQEEKPLVGGGEKAPYGGRMERINFTGGLSVEVFVPLVYAGPWLGPVTAVAAVVVIGVFMCLVSLGHAVVFAVVCADKDLQPKLRLANDPDASLWYVLRGFVAAVLLLPWLTLAVSCAFPWLPSACPLCVAGIAAAAQVRVELRWLSGALTGAKAWRSLLSKLETLDACTDGAVVVVACSIDEAARRRFVESFAGNILAKLLAEHIGVGGLFLAALSYATALQVCSFGAVLYVTAKNIIDGMFEGRPKQKGINFLADACGLGALAEEVRDPLVHNDDHVVKLLSGICRTFAETVPQLFLQTSLLMATDASLLAQPLLGMSLLSSCGVLFARTCAVAKPSWALASAMPVAGLVVFPLVLLLGASNLVLWGRIYYSEACASREWGLTTGCVELAE